MGISVAVVDIGTDKVVTLIGELEEGEGIHIIGVGEVKSVGVEKGVIKQLDTASRTIAISVRKAEEMAGVNVREVFINVSGHSLKSENFKESVSVSSTPAPVTDAHVQRLLELGRGKSVEENYEILHVIPRYYTLDDQSNIQDPRGLSGCRLSADIHVIKIGRNYSLNLQRAVEKAGFSVVGRVVSALASAEAVLREEEKEDGVLLIDMGAGLTDFVLYLDGSPALTGTIPFGGINVTKDISFYFRLPGDEAERIKKEKGHAFSDDVSEEEIITIKPRGETKQVSIYRKELAKVIEARIAEIIEGSDRVEGVFTRIERENFKISQARAGIVITGGCANLEGITQLVEDISGLAVRVGKPEGLIGLRDKVADPKFATAVGILKYALSSEDIRISPSKRVSSQNGLKESFLSKILEKVRKFFKDIA